MVGHIQGHIQFTAYYGYIYQIFLTTTCPKIPNYVTSFSQAQISQGKIINLKILKSMNLKTQYMWGISKKKSQT